MNEDKAKQKDPDVERQVSDRYESLAIDTTPAHLDLAIMREAKRALRADSRGGSLGAWFRPVAFVATVLLCLAVVIDLSDSGIFELPATSFDATTPPPARSQAEQPIDTTMPVRNQAALNELKRQEKSPATGAQTDDTAAGAAATAGATAEPEQGRLTKLQAAPPDTESRSAGERTSDALAAAGACSTEQQATAATWWQCIESLRESGRNEAANLELEKLRQEFPEFALPE